MIGALTSEEEARLWKGKALWHEKVEGDGSGSGQPGKGTKATHEAFDDFAREKKKEAEQREQASRQTAP